MKSMLYAAAALLYCHSCPAEPEEPGPAVAVTRDQEVMFVNGARVRCGADCVVRVSGDRSLRITLPQSGGDSTLHVQALLRPIQVTIRAGEQWLTYEIAQGWSARFEHGQKLPGSAAALLNVRTEESLRQDERTQRAQDTIDSIGERSLARTPLGRRAQDVSVR